MYDGNQPEYVLAALNYSDTASLGSPGSRLVGTRIVGTSGTKLYPHGSSGSVVQLGLCPQSFSRFPSVSRGGFAQGMLPSSARPLGPLHAHPGGDPAGNLTVMVNRRVFEGVNVGFQAVIEPLCVGGTFSTTGAPVNGTCPGLCAPGHACPSGSTNSTAQLCAPGSFSVGGAGVCTPCLAGKWSAVAGRSEPCVSDCAVGHYCPAGSTNATAAVCPAGRYSSKIGAGVCTPCAGGTWSDAVGRTVACSSECIVGYACPAGSANGTAVLCPSGTLGLGGAESCPTYHIEGRFVSEGWGVVLHAAGALD